MLGESNFALGQLHCALKEKRESLMEIPALNALALRSLASLAVDKEKLFSRSLSLGPDGLHREKVSPRRTIIALLGLQRLAESGVNLPFDLRAMRDAVSKDTSWVSSLGDLGLLIWFTAECMPERLEKVLVEFDLSRAIETFSDGRHASTTGLAWFLAGISHVHTACDGTIADLTDPAVDAYHLLLNNQGEGGIFGHSAFPGLLQRNFGKRFGTFSDQIYAVYALATFAHAYRIEDPLESALRCAHSIRALQGAMGQWWFLYDRRACCVANRYPVLSMHQDGTAPVGLLALSKASGQSFHDAILKGLSWIAGANELGDDLRNQEWGLIWDSVGTAKRKPNYLEAALSALNISWTARTQSLKIYYRVRPDHCGWLLYAFGKFGLPQENGCGASTS